MIRYDGEVSSEVIKKLIDGHQVEVKRYEKLQRYYEGKNDILDRTKKDASKPNNKAVSGYPAYIIDVMQGYFLGKGVNYTSIDDRLMGEVQDIFNLNDEADENSELSKMAGIKGKSYEIVYVDEEARLRFNEIDADNMIMVYDTKINPNANFAIRYYNQVDILTDEEVTHVEVYTDTHTLFFIETDAGYSLVEEKEHYFGQVPVIEILNNDEAIGDFERVLSLIDMYDKAQSDTANDLEEFTDAFLCLVGMLGTTKEDIEELKEDKVLLLDEKGQAEWLIKQINDSAIENYKNRLNEDIHRFSKTIDMSDMEFSAGASGISLQYKLLGQEQVVANKERKFKRALQKRLELIVAFLNIHGGNYDYRDIDIQFTRNTPINMLEEVQVATALKGLVSESTAISTLSIVNDVTAELEKIEKEREEYVDLDSIPLEEQEDDIEEDDVDEEVI